MSLNMPLACMPERVGRKWAASALALLLLSCQESIQEASFDSLLRQISGGVTAVQLQLPASSESAWPIQLSISPDARTAALIDQANAAILVYDLRTGALVRKLNAGLWMTDSLYEQRHAAGVFASGLIPRSMWLDPVTDQVVPDSDQRVLLAGEFRSLLFLDDSTLLIGGIATGIGRQGVRRYFAHGHPCLITLPLRGNRLRFAAIDFAGSSHHPNMRVLFDMRPIGVGVSSKRSRRDSLVARESLFTISIVGVDGKRVADVGRMPESQVSSGLGYNMMAVFACTVNGRLFTAFTYDPFVRVSDTALMTIGGVPPGINDRFYSGAEARSLSAEDLDRLARAKVVGLYRGSSRTLVGVWGDNSDPVDSIHFSQQDISSGRPMWHASIPRRACGASITSVMFVEKTQAMALLVVDGRAKWFIYHVPLGNAEQ